MVAGAEPPLEVRKRTVYVCHCNLDDTSRGKVDQVLSVLGQQQYLEVVVGKKTNIPSQVDREAVACAIERSNVAVLFMNNDSLKCRICRSEIEYIYALRKRSYVVELEENWRSTDDTSRWLTAGRTSVMMDKSSITPIYVALKLLIRLCGQFAHENETDSDYFRLELKPCLGLIKLGINFSAI